MKGGEEEEGEEEEEKGEGGEGEGLEDKSNMGIVRFFVIYIWYTL